MFLRQVVTQIEAERVSDPTAKGSLYRSGEATRANRRGQCGTAVVIVSIALKEIDQNFVNKIEIRTKLEDMFSSNIGEAI
jgi:hypothetical protein